MYNLSGDALGYVAYDTILKSIVIVYRGTLPWSLQDWMDVYF
jgi:hypothetical protein